MNAVTPPPATPGPKFQDLTADVPRPRAAGRTKDLRTRRAPSEQDLRLWAMGCPLWRWRAKQHVSRPMAAMMLGVNSTTIWQWEHGAVRPKRIHMAALVDLLGPLTVVHWVEWMSKRPGWGQGREGDL